MPLPKKYHAVTFMSILVMLLLLGLYLLSGGYTGAESQLAESRAAALARANSTTQHLQLPSSSNNIFSSQQQHQQAPPAYRHPIVYDKLTGATNNQINEVLGAVKPPGLVLADYPIDHYQQQQQQPPPQGFYHHPAGGPNLLADAQQQQRHRQQMLDRQMLFGPSSPFGSASPLLPPPPPPPPATALDFPPNQTDGYNPNAALYRQQQQQQQPPLMPTQFSMPPPPLPPAPPPPSQRDQQQQQQPAPSNQAPPIRPPYAHLAPSNMPPAQPLSQYEQQQQQQTQLKPAAQSRIIPLNSRIDPTSATPPSQLLLSPPQQQQQQQQQPQMVLASNQAPPPRSSNSVAPPPPPLSINNNVGANRLTAPPAPLCVRQQIDQQHQQQVPATAEATNASTTTKLQMPVLFCNLDPEYPTKEIMRALEIYAREQRSIEQLMPQLLVQLHIQAQPARQPGGNHQLITLDQLQYALQPASSAGQAWQNNSSEQQPPPLTQFPSANFEQMCRSTIQMAQPRRAKNLAGQWKVVVNLPGHKYRGIAISQMVRVEECSNPLGECATPAKPSIGLAKSTCLQHYENQRLIAWSPQQGLHVDMFRMPVACSCHIRRS